MQTIRNNSAIDLTPQLTTPALRLPMTKSEAELGGRWTCQMAIDLDNILKDIDGIRDATQAELEEIFQPLLAEGRNFGHIRAKLLRMANRVTDPSHASKLQMVAKCLENPKPSPKPAPKSAPKPVPTRPTPEKVEPYQAWSAVEEEVLVEFCNTTDLDNKDKIVKDIQALLDRPLSGVSNKLKRLYKVNNNPKLHKVSCIIHNHLYPSNRYTKSEPTSAPTTAAKPMLTLVTTKTKPVTKAKKSAKRPSVKQAIVKTTNTVNTGKQKTGRTVNISGLSKVMDLFKDGILTEDQVKEAVIKLTS